VDANRLHRLHDGVYAVGRSDVPLRGRWLAAVLACGEGAMLSHGSAASLRGLLKASDGWIDVTVTNRSGRARPGLRIHRPRTLAEQDRREVDGIPCTSVARTLLDLAMSSPPYLLRKACNQAEIEQELDMREIEELLSRLPRHRGASRLRAALGSKGIDVDRTKTPLERRFLALCRKEGMAEPAVNEWMRIPGEEMQCDFVWHRERIVVEVDGWETHRTKAAFENDRRRDRLLRLHGWEVVRFTWDDVTKQPAHVIDVLRAMLGRQAA